MSSLRLRCHRSTWLFAAGGILVAAGVAAAAENYSELSRAHEPSRPDASLVPIRAPRDSDLLAEIAAATPDGTAGESPADAPTEDAAFMDGALLDPARQDGELPQRPTGPPRVEPVPLFSDVPPLDQFRHLRQVPVEEAPPSEPAPEPEPSELKLPAPITLWDVAQIEYPLFGTEEIAEFSREVTAQGRWNVRPHFSMTTVYDGNVFIEDKNATKDLIVRAAPGLALRLGNADGAVYLTGDYTLNAIFFSENTDQNSFDQSAGLNIQWSLAKTILRAQFSFSADSGTSIDASDRVQRVAFSASVGATYQYSDKVSFDLNGLYQPTEFENLLGSKETQFQAFANYQYSPKLRIGIGGGFGLTEVESGSDQTSETVLVRAIYVATGKVTLTGNVGAELRQFGDRGDSSTPVFGLDASWAAREGTDISLSGQRRIFSSAILENQNYTGTTITASVQQRLSDRFNVFLTLGFENLAYSATTEAVVSSREDNYYFVRTGVQWRALSWCNLGVFYEYGKNDSTGADSRSFQRDRAGLQIGIIF